jgi:hypothetical protein
VIFSRRFLPTSVEDYIKYLSLSLVTMQRKELVKTPTKPTPAPTIAIADEVTISKLDAGSAAVASRATAPIFHFMVHYSF